MSPVLPLFGLLALLTVGVAAGSASSASTTSAPRGSLTVSKHARLTQEQVDFLYRLRAATPPEVPIHVTSGYRTMEQQAAAMLNKHRLGGDQEIIDLYGKNGRWILQFERTVPSWTAALWQRIREGKMPRKGHTVGKAVDIRTNGLTPAQIQSLVDASRRIGARPLVERNPAHLHDQFSGPGVCVVVVDWC